MSWRYTHPMEPAQMNATLALLTPDEVEDALRFVEICEWSSPDIAPAELGVLPDPSSI